jgi:hypothetical protein
MGTISLGHDMLTERMHHMIDDVLPGGFLPTICGTCLSFEFCLEPLRRYRSL